MSNWAWPHTPASIFARILLADGPAAGEQAAFIPPDIAAPVQVVWSTWIPGVGPAAFLYEWHGETTTDRGRTDALIFHCIRRYPLDSIPPVIADAAEEWADAADLLMTYSGYAPDVLWPMS